MVTHVTWSDGFLRVVTDTAIKGECYRVLFIILGSLTDESFSSLTPRSIARVLHVHESSVKRAIRILIAKGIIRKRHHPSGNLIGYEVVEFFGASEQ